MPTKDGGRVVRILTVFGCLIAALALPALKLQAALPKATITRVRIYKPPNLNALFNQSNMVVTVETDIGVTGVGEGGSKDTLEQCAGTLIGKNPFRIEAIWQEMYMAWFYPPGREKVLGVDAGGARVAKPAIPARPGKAVTANRLK